jgi:pyruvate-formate lyase
MGRDMDNLKIVRFADERALFEKELEAYYRRPALDTSGWENELHAQSRKHPRWSPFRRKIPGYQLMAGQCPVHVFRHCPFYFEINTGRKRTDLGTGGLGGWLKRDPANQMLHDSSAAWVKLCLDIGLSDGWPMLDDNHHTLGYEKVLRFGLRGLIRQAQEQLKKATTQKERDFLHAAIAGDRALIRVAERLADRAEALLKEESAAHIRPRFERIASTARHVPAEPATTFYEALNTLLFLFYTLPSIEGNGVSVFGHVDRILIPFYRRDIAKGRLTEPEARDLLSFFMAISDTRFGMRSAEPRHVGTNGTITIGGCDRQGRPVFNELTRLILDVHRDLRLIDPKVNARISPQHPAEYFERLAAFNASGGNSLSIFNDDVVIRANVRMGKKLNDCRLYVGGGCQENVLETCEINSRATIYLNLLQVFLAGFSPEKLAPFLRRAGIQPVPYRPAKTYEDFHAAFLHNLKAINNAHIDERNRTEAEGWRYNPCPMHSGTLDDCIRRRKDMMEGGCRYNSGSVSLTGIGTLVDSLFAVKTAVYDQQMATLEKLGKILETNFKGEEIFRSLLARRIAKFGQNDPAIRKFSARVFTDLAATTSGRKNSRGGRYEASLFSFRSFEYLATDTGATPDGRKAGEPLSPGMGPSLLALGHKTSIGDLLAAMEPLDMTLYPVVAVLDAKLPAARGGIPSSAVVPVIRRFLAVNGSVLQLNCVDQAVLREARKHPERHPDLIVRVSGYSSYFTLLAESIQDEIIARTVTDA